MPKERPADAYNNSILSPTYQSASYYFDNEEDVRVGLHEKSIAKGRYGRYDNPTWVRVEQELCRLCRGESALLFGSGMAAHTTAFMTLLEDGDEIVLPSESYRQVRNLLLKVFPKFGIKVHEHSIIDTEGFVAAVGRLRGRVKLVHLEMPSSPHMYLIDVQRIREAVGPETIITMDSSFAPPPNFYALDWGVDIALFSATKYLNGHGDIMAGCLVGRKDLVDEIKWYRDCTGGICDGNVAYLLGRSLFTLDLRMERINSMAVKVATFLESHPAVSRVYYNGLDSHPHRALASKYLNGFGGVITFELPLSEVETAQFVDRLKVPFMASNFGAPQTLVEQSTFFTYYEYSEEELIRIGVPRGTVRLALGYADKVEDIVADLGQALDGIAIANAPDSGAEAAIG